jgi:NRE family putative nickel resistance protein-like MFS transporter
MGPMLAGLLVAWLGLDWLFWFDAVTYLFSVGLVAACALPKIAKPLAGFSIRELLNELSFGIRLLLRQHVLRRALMLNFVEAIAGAAAIVATVIYVKDVLGLGDRALRIVC